MAKFIMDMIWGLLVQTNREWLKINNEWFEKLRELQAEESVLADRKVSRIMKRMYELAVRAEQLRNDFANDASLASPEGWRHFAEREGIVLPDE